MFCKGDNKPECDSIIIPDCDEHPCDIVRGEHAEQFVTFTAQKTLNAMSPAIRAKALGITLDYEVDADQLDVCANLDEGYSCPIEDGETATWIYAMSVPTIYPAIGIELDIGIKDQDDDDVCCFKLNINLK